LPQIWHSDASELYYASPSTALIILLNTTAMSVEILTSVAQLSEQSPEKDCNM